MIRSVKHLGLWKLTREETELNDLLKNMKAEPEVFVKSVGAFFLAVEVLGLIWQGVREQLAW